MNYDKPFLTYEDQIRLLRKRGLIIEDEQLATQILSTVSYYDIINRYKSHYMSIDNTFIDNITLEYLYLLFLFDKNLQASIMKYSMLVENIFKTRFAYIMSNHFGVDYSLYLNSKNYKSNIANLTFIDVKKEIDKGLLPKNIKNPSKHYMNKHNHIPPWILLKNVSLGTSINLFRLLIPKYKYILANNLIPHQNLTYNDKTNLVKNTLMTVRLFRNCAAHNLNFTDFRVQKKYKPSIVNLYKVLGHTLIKKNHDQISKDDKQSINGLYGCILSILVLLNDNFLRAQFVIELLSIFEVQSMNKYVFYKDYLSITKMPNNINERFRDYYINLCANRNY